MSYNGWTNYETWAVNLWMSDSEMQAGYWQGVAEAIVSEYSDESEVDHLAQATRELAEQMKNEYQSEMPEVSGVWADLLGSAIERVDWREIAAHLVEAAAEEIDQEANSQPH